MGKMSKRRGKAGGDEAPNASGDSTNASADSTSTTSNGNTNNQMTEAQKKARYEEVLRKAAILRQQGVRLQSQAEYEKALAMYEQALGFTFQQLDRAWLLTQRSFCHEKLRHYDKAIMESTEALKISPGYSAALFRRAKGFEAYGLLKKALEDVQNILRREPSNMEALSEERKLRAGPCSIFFSFLSLPLLVVSCRRICVIRVGCTRINMLISTRYFHQP